MTKYFYILCTIFLCTSDQTDAMRSGVYFGQGASYGTGPTELHVYTTIANVVFSECMAECRNRAACDQIQYDVKSKFCRILKEPRNIQNTTFGRKVPGFVLGIKSRWTQITKSKNSETTINPRECGPPFDLAGKWNRGNMNTIDSRVMITHNDSSTEMFVCKTDGHWTSMQATCNNKGANYPESCNATGKIHADSSSCYILFWEEKMNYTEGQEKCKGLCGHLVDITSEEEQNFIAEMLDIYYKAGKIKSAFLYEEADWMYTGLHSTTGRDFLWSDQTSLDYSNWNSWQPHPNGGVTETFGEKCVILGPHYMYRWDKTFCMKEAIILCEIDLM